MVRIITILVLVVALAGCGSSDGDSAGATTEGRPLPTCGVKGFRIDLHKVTCEAMNAMVTILNGRALHQTLTLAWEHGHRVTWICISPTHSTEDRPHCRQGTRSFTIERISH
jgi:hypothetical protein